ncbi:hypothetical protein BV20DRAFT_1001090 [Pilatotrama ljubarskyi]|nr:hypothetical protein BV20DRAFT_1001090 [Pilatotrama ljubarskyi]
MAAIPPAPPLPGEARLEIFVYPDAVPATRPLEDDNKFSDARRLEVLGTTMTEMAYMDVLGKRWPKATAQQLTILTYLNDHTPCDREMVVPPAPQLPGEAALEIFVHPQASSAHHALDPDNKFSDGRRLEILGQKMTGLAYMDAMYRQWPNVGAAQLTILCNTTINGFMEKAVRAYRWKERVIGCPPHINLMKSNEEAHRLFRTYAGAVYVEHGYERLRDWVTALTSI